MSDIVKSVCNFNQEILGIEPRTPQMLNEDELEISVKSLFEEIQEYIESYASSADESELAPFESEAHAADAMLDLIYFAIGVMYKHGLTSEVILECFAAVHNANMTKKKGVNAKRATGAADAVKDESFVDPVITIREIIEKHHNEMKLRG